VIVVDTNVLVYAANQASPHHAPCRRWLEAQRGHRSAWFATWSIVYEFLRIVTHPRVIPSPWNAASAWGFVEALLATPGLTLLVPTVRHPEVAAEVIAQMPELSGNLFHDAHIAILMREHGISRICTRDTDFHRFPFVEVVDPLRA